MKTLYPLPTAIVVNHDIIKQARIFLAVLLLLVLSFQLKAQVVPELVFRNPVLTNGTANQNGAKYLFANAATGIDAILEIRNRSNNNVIVRTIDLTTTGWDKAFQPEVGIAGTVAANQTWWVEFEMTFVNAGTNNKRKITRFDVTALDVDGDNVSVREFVQMDKAKSISISNISNVTAGSAIGDYECGKCGSNGALVNCSDCGGDGLDADSKKCNRCKGTGKLYSVCGHEWDGLVNGLVQGPVSNFLNIDTAATAAMATYTFEDKDRIRFKIGGKTNANSTTAGVRLNSLWFRSFNLNSAVNALPLSLTNFTAKLDKQNVLLTWNTTNEKNFNHFLLERSVDGKEFKSTAMVFADDNGQSNKEYAFKDALNNITKGIVYYRLKMVDIDGQFKYSSTRVIRLDEQTNQSSIAAYPNPAKNDLRITVPNSWQDQKVVFDLYNVNGQVVKHIVNSRAGQTENLNVADIAEGLYIVKVTKGEETAVQRIVKVK